MLVLGAGCQGEDRQTASVQTGSQNGYETSSPAPSQPGEQFPAVLTGNVGVDAAAAVDAALKESDADVNASLEETADAGLLSNDTAELTTYGQAYVDADAR